MKETHWRVKLKGIEWYDGKGEYDVSDIATVWSTVVIAEDATEAVEFALSDATDAFGFLIVGYESADVRKLN